MAWKIERENVARMDDQSRGIIRDGPFLIFPIPTTIGKL